MRSYNAHNYEEGWPEEIKGSEEIGEQLRYQEEASYGYQYDARSLVVRAHKCYYTDDYQQHLPAEV